MEHGLQKSCRILGGSEHCVYLSLLYFPHSSTLAWKIPWTEEPGRLQSMGALRVGHNWTTSLSLFTFMNWRRKWQPTPVFLPGESQGRQNLVGCRLWGCTELDMTSNLAAAAASPLLWESEKETNKKPANQPKTRLQKASWGINAFSRKTVALGSGEIFAHMWVKFTCTSENKNS